MEKSNKQAVSDIFHQLNGRAWIFAALLQALLAVSLPSFVSAASVEVEILREEAIVGEELAFAIKFSVDSDNEVIDVSNVQYNGKPLPYEISSQSTSSFTMIINGKTVQSSSGLVKTYIFSLPAEKVGPMEVPGFKVSVANKEYKIKPLSFSVLDRPTSDDLQFLVEIKNQQSYYYPSQIIDLECSILYRNFQGAPSIEDISLPIMKDLSFQLLPETNPNFELIINNQRHPVWQRQGTLLFKGKQYNSLTFRLKFRIMNHGEFNFANSIKMIVETGRRYRKPSVFFGYDIVNETRPVFADSAPMQVSVQELPQNDVPPSFNGAIGAFKIKVTPSSDTAIRVGDPITLLIEISGRGTWEFVKSPPIERYPEITDYFIVSSDPVAGEVHEDKGVKSFSVRLRVKSKTVKEIPAIPFTFFNLASRKYETVFSDPVPIQVFDAATTATITDFGAPQPEPKGPDTSEKKDEAVVGSEINESDQEPVKLMPPLIQITDNVSADKTTKNHAPLYGRLIFAFLPLGAVFLFYLYVLYKGRGTSAAKNTRILSKNAGKKFIAELKSLSQKGADSSFAAILGRSILQFVEDRYQCNLPYLNKETLLPLVEENKLGTETAKNLLDLIEKVDQHRYGAAALGQNEAMRLLDEAKEVITKCD